MNDWPMKPFLVTCFALQLSFLACASFEVLGFSIPILGQFVGFAYLAFMPGLIILRILKLHSLGVVESLLYSVGLSVTFLFFIGLMLNTFGSIIGVTTISVTTLTLLYAVITTLLCVIGYLRDKDFSGEISVDINRKTAVIVIVLCLLPFMSIIGAFLMNFYNSNALLLTLFPILSVLPLLVAFDKIQKNLYPIVVLVISLSLLFSWSLISTNVAGWDIQTEYFFSNLVNTNHAWNVALPNSYNAMLSVVMLAPVLSQICNLSLVWVFKIMYPLLFSLVPLGLYRIFQRQTSNKVAMLSCSFFMFFYVFFTEMMTVARQQIAELFLVLFSLVVVSKELDRRKRTLLSTVFVLSLVVSHYGLSYIFMFFLIGAWLLLVVTERPKIRHSMNNFAAKFRDIEISSQDFISQEDPRSKDRTINLTIVTIFVASSLAWYSYVSSGFINSITFNIVSQISETIFSESPSTANIQGLALLSNAPGFGWASIGKRAVDIVFVFFIIVGFFAYLLTRKEFTFSREYTVLSLMSLVMLFSGFVVPYLSSQLNVDRIFHITLIFLAPFSVIGGTLTMRYVTKISHLFKRYIARVSSETCFKLLAIFLVAFLLFNSEWVTHVATEHISTISFDSKMDYPKFTDGEVEGARWLSNAASNSSSTFYGDLAGKLLLCELSYWQARTFEADTGLLPSSSFIFLRRINIQQNSFQNQSSAFYTTNITNRNKVYDNGYSQVYGG